MKAEKCPRCDAGRLRRWDELNADEQELVRRLPASADYPAIERATRHRWCTHCWFEDLGTGEVQT
jgi:hypothetical protein